MTWRERPKTFSAYPLRRRRTVSLLSLLQALPLQIGEFFDQPLHLLVVLDGLPHPLFPLPRHEQLPQLPPLAPNQVEAGMELAPGATTTGFAATNVTERED